MIGDPLVAASWIQADQSVAAAVTLVEIAESAAMTLPRSVAKQKKKSKRKHWIGHINLNLEL